MKLKKIQDHYYILSDETIKKGDWFIEFDLKDTRSSYCNKPFLCDVGNTGTFILTKDINFPFPEHCKKITHSTQKLKGVKLLDINEIEELIYGYSIEKMAENLDKSKCRNFRREHTMKETYEGIEDGFVLGFKAAMGINKDKLFTIEDMRKGVSGSLSIGYGNEFSIDNQKKETDRIIQYLLPKTEWNVEFVDGKIKLI